MLKTSPNFAQAIATAQLTFKQSSTKVHTNRWQGVDIATKPEMATRELLNYSLQVPVNPLLDILRGDIKPNLPWADDHFDERVCGKPINPGVEWANWPYGKSAATFLDEQGQFNHNYMERYWPKFAGTLLYPTKTADEYDLGAAVEGPHHGIYHEYGDLNDLVNQLAHEPDTRQAYMPIWFPEDTGVVHKGRVPCTLGYHFILRGGFFHCNYYLRSCDFVRHFRDDIYLTARLMLWVIDQCKAINPADWGNVQPGWLTMHITSFHIFEADWQPLFGNDK